MKDTKSKRKKKRSRAAVKPTTNGSPRGRLDDERRINSVSLLTDALEDVSLKEVDVDANKKAEILTTLSENSEDPSTASSFFGGSSGLTSSSSSSVGYVGRSCVQNMVKKGASRQKRAVAVTGTVANVLGKEYVRASQRKAEKFKEVVNDQNGFNEKEVEQFLYSMLGEDSELSMAVVKDVLLQCGYNVEKALESLMDLSASSNEQYGNCNDDFNLKEDARFCIGSSDNLTEVSDCTSRSSETDLNDNIWSMGFNCRNYSKVLSSEVSPTKPSGKFDLPQEVLESLFNISKSPVHEQNTMNWRNVVRKLQSVGPRFNVCPSDTTESQQQELCAKGDEYQVYRKDAKQHWDKTKSSYQKAAAAYSKGDWQYAAYLSDQGKLQTELARQADERATQDIFKARNRDIENVITIDLHGQHVKPAMKLFKLHLLMGSYVQSIQALRVITGCGSHGKGKSKLKHSKIGDLQNIRASYRLNGKNYLKWSQFVRTYLKGKGRLNHLLGTGPVKDDPMFEAWDEEDSMIMSWLWDSMDPMISDTCMFFATAKEIWDFIRRTYSKARDTAQVYDIKVKTTATKQGDKSVTEYANLLQNLWQELDHYRVFEMKCPEDAAILKSFIEKDRVYDFLAGLNPEFDQVRLQILGKEDTPSLEETISLIRAEESRRSVMLEPQTMEGSALVAKTDHQEKGKSDLPKYPGRENQWKENKDNLWCTHCKKPRHTKEKCWKLNGKPPSREWGNRGGQQRPQAHMAEQKKTEENSATGGFNSEEIEKLRSLLGSLEKPSGACSLALSGSGHEEEDWTC